MYLHTVFICNFLLISFTIPGTFSRSINLVPKHAQKQLFLSRRVVTDLGEFDGGILVDEYGIIEGVLSRSVIDGLMTFKNLNNIMGYSGQKAVRITTSNDNCYSLCEITDGGKLHLMAGVIDSHVHVNEPGKTSWEGFVTATQAAAWGGITTVVDMPLNSIPPTTSVDNFKMKVAAAQDKVFVDVAFWGGVIPGNENELLNLIDAGVVGLKCFLIDSGLSEFPMIEKVDLEQVFKILNGSNTVLAFHAEANIGVSISADSDARPDLYSTYLGSRPSKMEIDAVSLIATYLNTSDVHVHIVHVSAEGVMDVLEKAREKRILAGNKKYKGGVTAETCHHYLTLTAEEVPEGHTEFKCSPPIRDRVNREKLWEYIRDKKFDLVASDHSPSLATLKGPNFMESWGGISSVQFGLSLFWTEASARGYDLSTVSHFLSTGPAKLCGLEKVKGSLRPGLDADIIFFDPNEEFTVTPDVIRYKNKISPYMNRTLKGKVVQTYVRGQLVFSNGELIGEPKGKLLLNYD